MTTLNVMQVKKFTANSIPKPLQRNCDSPNTGLKSTSFTNQNANSAIHCKYSLCKTYKLCYASDGTTDAQCAISRCKTMENECHTLNK